MGCVSSTEVVTDPVTGEQKKKKRMGGAYPGQMGQQHAPYQPPASAFQNGTATAHFVSYGGGNALTLVQPDGSTKPQHGGPENQFIKVTLPEGVESGQKIHVQAPDGRLNEIIVPAGFGPGSAFTVEFAPASQAPTSHYPSNDKVPVQEAAAINNTRPPPTTYGQNQYNNNNNRVDDGFATGFNNPNWQPMPPPQQSTATATPVNQDPDIDLSAFPLKDNVPVAQAKLY